MTWDGKGWRAYANFLLVRFQRIRKSTRVYGRPYALTLDPSSYCNLRCPFCPTGQRNHLRSSAHLPLDRFKRLMDELGPYLFWVELYNWGEPFLNRDLVPMLEYMARYRIVSVISTNLDFPLSEGLIEQLVVSGLSTLIVSADGVSQASYERYRVGGHLDRVLGNMKMIVAAKQRVGSAAPRIVWRFLVFRHNEHEIEQAKSMAEEMGIELELGAPYIAIAQEPYRDWVSTIPQFNLYPSVTSGVQAEPSPAAQQGPQSGACDWLWMSAAVNANESVSPCCGIWEERHDFGKIGAGGFRALWNGERYRAARAFMRTGTPTGLNLICEQCPFPNLWKHASHFDQLILESFSKRLPGFMRNAVLRWVDADSLSTQRKKKKKKKREGDHRLQRSRIYPLIPAPPSWIESFMVRCRRGGIAFCPVCGRYGALTIEHDNLRETVRCSRCGAVNRQRQLAHVACESLSTALGYKITSLRQLASYDEIVIYNTKVGGPIHIALSGASRYLCGEYIGPECQSGAIVNGVVHQDLARLPYPDGSIDLVLSSDVFGHIPHPYAAHREVYRVLREGGRHIFTVPFYQTEFSDETRVIVGEDGTSLFVKEPLYHHDPIRPGRAALVHTIFALEMLLKLDQIGFRTNLYRLQNPLRGLLGQNGLVFEAVKISAGDTGLRLP